MITQIDAVLRLTNAGRLGQATSLLQQVLHGDLCADRVAGRFLNPPAKLAPDRGDDRESRKAGIGAPPERAGSSFERRSVRTKAGVLSYKLYVPSRYSSTKSALVVMLHGCTQSSDDFALGTRMNELAERHGFLVAYPEQTRAANVSRCWNWFERDHQKREQGEPSLIAAATRDVIEEFQVDPSRVFVAGLSAGGAAAAILGCTYPDLYAGIGVHSGLACGAAFDVRSAFDAMRGGTKQAASIENRVPTIVFHGTKDRTVSASNAESVAVQAGGSSPCHTVEIGRAVDGTSYSRTIRRNSDGAIIGEVWLIDGAGHAWSGGDPAGSFSSSSGPDASREMLRFFGIGAPAKPAR